VTNTRIEADGEIIADYDDTITNDDIDETPVFEVVERLRAAEVEVIDRGNVQTTFSFSLHRGFGKLTDAQAFRLMRKNIPRYAELLTLTTKDYNGGESKWFMSGVGIKVRRPQGIGVSAFADFTIIGGLFKDVKPK